MKPKALFICGSAGSGKSTLVNKIKKHFPLEFHTTINVDTVYETLLLNRIGNLNIHSYNKRERSIAASAMQDSLKVTEAHFDKAVANKQNILLDATGGSAKKILTKKEHLEREGYDTFMVMNWCDPIICLERNHNREGRKLYPSVLLSNWNSVILMYPRYIEGFGDDFIVNRGSDLTNEAYVPDQIVEKYFDTIEREEVERSEEQKQIKIDQMDYLHNFAFYHQSDYSELTQNYKQVTDKLEIWLLK